MSLYDLHRQPALHNTVLVLAMEGWVDAGLGAAAATAALLGGLDTEVVATFDTDTLLDHRARRPILNVVDGMNADLTWPAIELHAATPPDGRHVLILTGPEPDHQWRGFRSAVVELARRLNVALVVGLGAFPAPVPHTRPVKLASTATTDWLAAQVGYVPGSISVPAGVHAALEEAFATEGIPAVGLWARVPHYAAAMPYPAASIALLEGLASVAEVRIDHAELVAAAAHTKQRIDELVANSDEHGSMVQELEGQLDGEHPSGGTPFDATNLPSGDELVAQFEQFLRDESDGGA